jgi:hypothetical protein
VGSFPTKARDGKDFFRLQVSRIDAIIDELKKNTLRTWMPDQERGQPNGR